MQVIIMGRVADSAGDLENGRIEFAQAQRIDTGELLVTRSIAVAQVVAGELRTLMGGAFMLPQNPEGTAVRVREIFGGQTFEWWTAVPEAESVEYRELPIMESSSAPESVWGPPPWVETVRQMRDEAVTALEEGVAVAEGLGGLSGIQALIDDAQDAATQSASSAASAESSAVDALAAAESAASDVLAGTKEQADRAKDEADRATAAANSVDMEAINERLDGMVEKTSTASRVYGTDGSGGQSTYGVSVPASGSSVVQRNPGGQIQTSEPTDDVHAATKKYVDQLREQLASDLAEATRNALQLQDMVTAVRIGTSPNGGVELSGAFEFAVLTPSQQIEITGCYLVFDNDQALPASTTKSINWRLFHRKSTPEAAIDIVQKSTAADGMTVRRKVWDMTNGTWGAVANRRVPKGSVISLLPTDFVGGAKITFPMLVVLHWRPVR